MFRRAVLLLSVLTLPAAAHAQRTRQCELEWPNTPETRQLTVKLPTAPGAAEKRNTFFGGGFVAHCKGQDLNLRADSAEIYGDENRVYLVGNVKYDEARMHVTSDYLTYFQVDERVVAAGNVNAVMASGSSLRGPQAEYRRAVPRVRAVAELSAIARPTLNLVEKQAKGAKPQPPTEVIANTLFMQGDSLVYAGGQVMITRPDLTSRSDSAFLNSQREIMHLIGHPVLDGKKEKPYQLTGTLIHAWSKNRQLTRVLSMGAANAKSEDMTLTADTIDLRVQNELLDRAVAWGKGRAHAVSPSQDVTADSIDVVMPGQRVRTMYAIKGARAEGAPDTLRIHTTERDWLSGDTIVAHFDTVQAAGDTAKSPPLRQILARGDAKSFYHLPAQDSTAKQPAINYVTGKSITVNFEKRQLQQVIVAGQKTGVYLEPTPPDTAAARPRTQARPRP